MKYTKLLAAVLAMVSLGAVSAPAVHAASASTTIQQTFPLKGVAKVTYKTPIVVWSAPGQKPIHKYLPRNSSWRYFKVANTADGQSWYNLGGNQWIPSRYVNYGQDPQIGFSAPSVKKGAIATVRASKGTRIYRNAGVAGGTKTEATSRVLPQGSRWKVFDSVNYGVPFYNLGGNQWVNALDVSVK